MNWTRLSPTESIAADYRGSRIARVWRNDAGWFGSVDGKQSAGFDDESSAREWAEDAQIKGPASNSGDR